MLVHARIVLLFLFSSLLSKPVSWSQVPDSWIRQNDFSGNARSNAVAFSLLDQGYVGTGRDVNGNLLKDFWKFDPGSGVWTQVADFGGTARTGAVGFAIDSSGYLGTGMDGSGLVKDFWKYNPLSNDWQPVQSLGQFRTNPSSERRDASCAVSGNQSFVICGYDGSSGYVKQNWRFDPLADTSWILRQNLANVNDLVNFGRRWAVAFTANNYVFFGTGLHYTQNYRGDVWRYDPLLNAWSQVADFGGSFRSNAIAFSLHNQGYVGCGTNGNYHNDLWKYNPNTNSWLQVASFPGNKIVNAVAFVIKNRAYVGLGNDSLLNMNQEIWCYVPDSTTGIEEVSRKLPVRIFPNPATEKAELQISGSSGPLHFTLFNMEGSIIRKEIVSSQNFHLERAGLRSGIYLIKIEDEFGNTASKKIIFQ